MATPTLAPKHFRFGQQVTILGTLHRERHSSNGKRWWEQSALKTPRLGIVIRKVTLQNGIRHAGYGIASNWDDEYEPPTWEALEYFTAYEVAYSLHRKTVLVRADDLEVVE